MERRPEKDRVEEELRTRDGSCKRLEVDEGKYEDGMFVFHSLIKAQ